MLRQRMKAGITGWAQVNGWRGNTDLKKRIEHDIYYIENWSIGFDMKIIWLTFWKGLINRNAYCPPLRSVGVYPPIRTPHPGKNRLLSPFWRIMERTYKRMLKSPSPASPRGAMELFAASSSSRQTGGAPCPEISS